MPHKPEEMLMSIPLTHPHKLAQLVATHGQDPQAYAAWASLYSGCHDLAIHYVVRTFNLARETAEDIVGSFFVGLPEKLSRAQEKVCGFKESKDFMYWFRHVLRNHTYDHLRRTRRFVARESEHTYTSLETHVDESAHVIDAEKIWALIKQLKYPEREVLLLYYGWSFNQRQIAEMLDLSHDNVRRIKLRALAKIRTRIHQGQAEQQHGGSA